MSKQQWAIDTLKKQPFDTIEEKIKGLWAEIKSGAYSVENRKLRAPSPFVATRHNGPSRRTYRSPIAEWLDLDIARELGSYCPKWPRTRRSFKEEKEAIADVIAWFEKHAA